jgi:hypothetical protein
VREGRVDGIGNEGWRSVGVFDYNDFLARDH